MLLFQSRRRNLDAGKSKEEKVLELSKLVCNLCFPWVTTAARFAFLANRNLESRSKNYLFHIWLSYFRQFKSLSSPFSFTTNNNQAVWRQLSPFHPHIWRMWTLGWRPPCCWRLLYMSPAVSGPGSNRSGWQCCGTTLRVTPVAETQYYLRGRVIEIGQADQPCHKLSFRNCTTVDEWCQSPELLLHLQPLVSRTERSGAQGTVQGSKQLFFMPCVVDMYLLTYPSFTLSHRLTFVICFLKNQH